ncbi:MAG: hypothetical protein CUN52_08510 [Phototrophicales bacterium]|jgi:hypothetical protein|nr:MAG: hypothetical protein CUN52_08510 [Phototrophicales bacterium]
MVTSPEKIVSSYTEAYQRLYNRKPKDLEMDGDWVTVNGAKMKLADLQYLTEQLREEYDKGIGEKKNVVNRLLKWFKGI